MIQTEITNRNKELSLLWTIFFIKKQKDQNFKFNKIFKYFDNFNNFELKIKKLKNKLFDSYKQPSFFNKNNNELDKKINILHKKILNKWNESKINSIHKFDFKDINLLKNVKNTNFLFFKGNKKLLNLNRNNIISVVGSRKTPDFYNKKMKLNIPKNKIIVSGLAFGADLEAHKKAIENKQNIIVFPGNDISKNSLNSEKNKVLKYAEKNGIVFTEIIPYSNMWNKSFLLKRNKTMAQISSETYVVWFEGQSGTLGQVLEAVRNNNKIHMFKEIYENNKFYLKNHNTFKEINKKIINLII